ncbi:hypothetical protein AC579_3515 [Pseudocercospora musae]|uniref:DUF6594 domain-containing protein n=1 Tax=Pseudocercospora musae TaxID=113226 RepID=A0A139I3Q9_9PEZI|nr:hypothetical protein AC579_3515 [Pseudocercospora musae]
MPYVHVSSSTIQKAAQSIWTSLNTISQHATTSITYQDDPGHSEAPDLEAEGSRHLAAWKFVGYPGLSKWLAASADGPLLRKFADLNVRVLLKKQNKIVEYERELKSMDDFAMSTDQGGCGSLRLDEGTPRGELLDEIDDLLRDYNGRLVEYLRLQEQPNATPEQVGRLHEWLVEHPNAIEQPEADFASREDDLMPLQNQRCGILPSLRRCLRNVQHNLLRSKRGRKKSVLSQSILLVPLLLLLAPAWAMSLACDCTQRMAIVTLFTTLFCLFLVSGTNLRMAHQSLATAGLFLESSKDAPAADVCEMFVGSINRNIWQYQRAALIISLI